MADSTRAVAHRKPYKDFPLFPHKGTGYWAKKVRGRTVYFGKIADDPTGDKALKQWQDWGTSKDPGVTLLKDLCNQFLTAKMSQRDADLITPRHWRELKETTDRVIKVLKGSTPIEAIGPADFEKLFASFTTTATGKKCGPERLGNLIQKTRSVFKYAYDVGLLKQPMRFGPTFKRPPKRVMRVKRAEAGQKSFSRAEIVALLAKANSTGKAMILLGLNCAFGNDDCAKLPIANIDLKAGWIRFPRPKTGIDRRCPLWKETVQALKVVLERRKDPADPAHAGLVFVTKRGGSFSKSTGDNPVAKEFNKVAKAAGVTKHGRGFYGLRHSFRTIADETRDIAATDLIMGHADPSMGDRYREYIDDSRLVMVVAHVRKWVFGKSKPSAR